MDNVDAIDCVRATPLLLNTLLLCTSLCLIKRMMTVKILRKSQDCSTQVQQIYPVVVGPKKAIIPKRFVDQEQRYGPPDGTIAPGDLLQGSRTVNLWSVRLEGSMYQSADLSSVFNTACANVRIRKERRNVRRMDEGSFRSLPIYSAETPQM